MGLHFALGLSYGYNAGGRGIFLPGAGLETAELGLRTRVSRPLAFLIVGALVGLSPVPALALPPYSDEAPSSTKSFDYSTYTDTNDLLMFVTNRGWVGHDRTGLLGRASGLYFPRGGNKTTIYAAGLWMACRMGKGFRASVAEYDADFSPGPVVSGSPPADNETFRVYKLAAGDSPESNADYAEWPFEQGAPAVKDQYGNDVFDENGDRIPRIMGDQTMWCAFNDLVGANHVSDPGSVLPMGAEVQLLAWSDDWPGSLDRTVFLNYMIINRSDSVWREARFGVWADPDIGRAGDDLAGSDSALALGYCYNNGPDAIYGEAPPAVGFALLAGPAVVSPGDSAWSVARARWIRNRRPLSVHGYSAWGNGGDPTGESGVYYVLSGMDKTGLPQVDPSNNKPTTFFYSGDVSTQTGWLDNDPSDRRFIISAGPVTVAPGDTVEIVAAALVGQGATNIESVESLKQTAATAHALYRGCFARPFESAVDILPGGCPNVVSFEEPLDLEFDFVRPAAAIPTTNVVIALYSSTEFDATAADPQEVLLDDIAPASWTIEDVGRYSTRETPCDCGVLSRDGRVDLLLSYDRDKIAEALEPLVEGAVRTLQLRTVGRDGSRSVGSDCITFIDLEPINDPLPPAIGPTVGHPGFTLGNQPNPFNAATMIHYRIATDGPVNLEVYDILGRRMATLVDAWQRAGEYQVIWNGVDLRGAPAGSGMYFYRLQSDDGVLTRKMILLK